MSIDPNDTELVAAVREAPTPEERAALLGVDFARLTAAAKRLEWLAAAGCAAVLFTAGVVLEFMPSSPLRAAASSDLASFELDVPALLLTIAGGLITVVLVMVAYIGGLLLAAVAARRRGQNATRAISTVVVGIAIVGAVAGATAIGAGSGSLDLLRGAVAGAALAPLVFLMGLNELPLALKRNSPGLVAVAHANLAAPPWVSLVGDRVRWQSLGITLTSAAYVSLAALLAVSQLWALPATLLIVVTEYLGGLAIAKHRRAAWLLAQLAQTLPLAVTAVVVLAA